MTNEERVKLIHTESEELLYKLLLSGKRNFAIMPTMSFSTFEEIIECKNPRLSTWAGSGFSNGYVIWPVSWGFPPFYESSLTVQGQEVVISRYATNNCIKYFDKHHIAVDNALPLGKVKINVWCKQNKAFL